MAISACTSGLAVTALVALLLLPAPLYFPGLQPTPPELPPPASPPLLLTNSLLSDVPQLDLLLTGCLILLAVMTHLFDWIQRKLMERRLQKVNWHLSECAARLRGWDARQGQQEATLRMVQNATTEYNLLLYLLLRRRKPPAPCCLHKLDEFGPSAPTGTVRTGSL